MSQQALREKCGQLPIRARDSSGHICCCKNRRKKEKDGEIGGRRVLTYAVCTAGAGVPVEGVVLQAEAVSE